MKAQHYREMSTDELGNELAEHQKKLFELHSQAVTEKLENSKVVRNARRDIARMKTVLQERAKAETGTSKKS